MLTPSPYSVQPGQCPVHEVRPGEKSLTDEIAAMQALIAQYRQRRAETILQQAVKPWQSYWRIKQEAS